MYSIRLPMIFKKIHKHQKKKKKKNQKHSNNKDVNLCYLQMHHLGNPAPTKYTLSKDRFFRKKYTYLAITRHLQNNIL